MRNNNMKIYFLSATVLLITFILGAFTGAGIMTTFTPGSVNAPLPPPHDRPGRHDDGPGGHGDPLFHPLPLGELNLSKEQKEKVFTIMEENRPRLDAIFDDTFPRLQKEMAQMDAKIRKLLNGEQKTKFDQMLEERKKRMQDKKPPMPKGRPPF